MKNNYLTITLSAIVFSYSFFSCSNSNHCPDGELNNVPIEVIPDSLYCKLQSVDSMKGQEIHKIIQTQNDLEKYVFCVSSMPAVDFNSYFIIAGKVFSPKCAHISDLQLVNCPALTLTITIDSSGDGGLPCGAEVVLYYFIKVEKKYSGDVKVVINEKN